MKNTGAECRWLDGQVDACTTTFTLVLFPEKPWSNIEANRNGLVVRSLGNLHEILSLNLITINIPKKIKLHTGILKTAMC